ncbi:MULTISPECIES: hypothetical protein [unclassified Streptomyces]|uniref:hypothetical protein n=1 Tax=unclassified Streptomyces TaxID=2593676 RepID=UPI002030BE3E|nr:MULTISPECIES: hypothetical protein [unclassified Streptomyces]MCM1966815.1 hypothetical protein [Streptomyces sp. G1]MCX5128755.1 hypothetical protein [Streptomyces sp. NBC_00347]MCX5299292.1 hypothetical protein [Streptomyces sp. NBC_00193]
MFTFRVQAAGPDPVVVHFEPLAWQVVVDPGDHIVVEWPDGVPGPESAATFVHAPDGLMIYEPHFLPGQERSWARVWNSAGEEITY